MFEPSDWHLIWISSQRECRKMPYAGQHASDRHNLTCKVFYWYFIHHDNNPHCPTPDSEETYTVFIWGFDTWQVLFLQTLQYSSSRKWQWNPCQVWISNCLKAQESFQYKGDYKGGLRFYGCRKLREKCPWKVGTVNKIINLIPESVFLHPSWNRIKRVKKINVYI